MILTSLELISFDPWCTYCVEVADISRDFIRFMDLYVRDVFTTGIQCCSVEPRQTLKARKLN